MLPLIKILLSLLSTEQLMEDNVSCASSSTCDDYYVVHSEPKLRVPDNGGQEAVTHRLSEVLRDEGMATPTGDLSASQCSFNSSGAAVKENPFNTDKENESGDRGEGKRFVSRLSTL